MAYTNETTHFGFPLPLGSDLTVPMDYNKSLEDADNALYEAQTNAAGAVGTAGNALTVANEAKTEAQSATAAANSATATAQAAATAANEAVAAVAEAKDDALDMICAVVEETATAQYKHEPTADGLNYYFRYNDILYKTTVVINVGDTIVPNTNCAATNVATELLILLNSGGGIDSMKKADFTSAPLYSNSGNSNFSYTATEECFAFGTIYPTGSAHAQVKVNTVAIGDAYPGDNSFTTYSFEGIHLDAGDVISCSGASTTGGCISIFKVKAEN